MTSPSPGQIARYLKNKHYKTEEEYVFALADVMKREYKAIVDAGFLLQLDCPDLAMLWHTTYRDQGLPNFRKIIAANVAALNHAVADIPADRMRMHVCWGSTMSPRHHDIPLNDIVDIILGAKPTAVSFPAANGRHEHEWKIWREVKLPPGKVIIPGVIDSTVNTVEHPELVADRLVNFANVVGRESCHRRRRLRLRHICRTRPGRHQDRLDEAAVAGRRRGAGLEATVEKGGVSAYSPNSRAGVSTKICRRIRS